MKAQLIKELKEMAKSGAGYVSVRNFIKDFDLGSVASVSELTWESKYWKLSIRKGHKYEHLEFLA